MNRISRSIVIALSMIALVVLSGCRRKVEKNPYFEASDYSVPSNWYETGRAVDENLVDVFYVLPTCVYDTKDENGRVVSRFADPTDPEQRSRMEPSYELAMSIFADSANFFAPYYKHMSLDVWVDGPDSLAKYSRYAMQEVKDAFKYYMENINNGRQFVLAGFSQGGQGVVTILKSLNPEQYSRMIAAYVCGYKVTEEDLQSPYIIPARTYNDTGVTIVYNTVSSEDAASDVLSGGNKVCINPFSWKTNRMSATHGGMTATISQNGEYVLLSGVDPEAYYVKSLTKLFPLGNLHLGELTIYEDVLRENVKQRTR